MRRGTLAAGYLAVLLAPVLMIAGAVKPGSHTPAVVFADALGFAALSLIALQVLASGRWAATTRAFGLRALLSLHRQAGAAILVLVAAHLVVLFADDPRRLWLLDSETAPGRARAGMVALLGLAGLAFTSLRRTRLPHQLWRALHLALTVAVLAGAFVHVMWVDAYTSIPDVRETVLGLVLVAALALFWFRVGRPYATAGRAYRVRAVRPERGDAVTVELAADGHAGLRFAPGQFARLRSATGAFGLDDHPFTLSSSAAHPRRPAFTIKALGDFSGAAAALPVGTVVLVDGPHGEGLQERDRAAGRLLVAAGIGITPAISVLRTAAHRGDDRPHLLLYGSRRWADVTFREELAALGRALPGLTVVHVLSRAEPGWGGARGRIDAALLARVLPPGVARWSALVCGPPALVAETERALLALGVPRGAIQAEGFA